MRKTQIALAAVALVASSAALAQVSVYGNADGSILTGGGTTSFDGGGGYTTSLLGFRGSEDLGGGLKASFNIESSMNLGAGHIGAGGGNNLAFGNRAANVSLGNDMIGVTAGNQLSIVVGDALTGATAGAGDNVNIPAVVRLLRPQATVDQDRADVAATGGFSGFFIPEAVTLRASAGGLTLKAQTRVGTRDATNSGYTAFTVTGAFEGFNFAAGQQQSSGFSLGDYKTIFFAGNTKLGDLSLNGAFANNTGLFDAKTYMVGASYPLSDAASLGGIYARGEAGDNQTSINLKYSLSKQTVAYVTTSMFSLAGGGVAATNTAAIAAGAKNATSIGISHSF